MYITVNLFRKAFPKTTRVKGRVEILQGKIQPDLDTEYSQIMEERQRHTCPLPLFAMTDEKIENNWEKRK